MSVVGIDKTLAINYTDPGEISVAYGSRLLQQDAHYWEIGHIYCGDGDSCSHFGIITMTSRDESDTLGLPTLQESPPAASTASILREGYGKMENFVDKTFQSIK